MIGSGGEINQSECLHGVCRVRRVGVRRVCRVHRVCRVGVHRVCKVGVCRVHRVHRVGVVGKKSEFYVN